MTIWRNRNNLRGTGLSTLKHHVCMINTVSIFHTTVIIIFTKTTSFNESMNEGAVKYSTSSMICNSDGGYQPSSFHLFWWNLQISTLDDSAFLGWTEGLKLPREYVTKGEFTESFRSSVRSWHDKLCENNKTAHPCFILIWKTILYFTKKHTFNRRTFVLHIGGVWMPVRFISVCQTDADKERKNLMFKQYSIILSVLTPPSSLPALPWFLPNTRLDTHTHTHAHTQRERERQRETISSHLFSPSQYWLFWFPAGATQFGMY